MSPAAATARPNLVPGRAPPQDQHANPERARQLADVPPRLRGRCARSARRSASSSSTSRLPGARRVPRPVLAHRALVQGHAARELGRLSADVGCRPPRQRLLRQGRARLSKRGLGLGKGLANGLGLHSAAGHGSPEATSNEHQARQAARATQAAGAARQRVPCLPSAEAATPGLPDVQDLPRPRSRAARHPRPVRARTVRLLQVHRPVNSDGRAGYARASW